MLFRKCPRLFVAIILFCSLSLWSQEPGAYQKETLRVLFIGNSYTYFNNLPEIFAKMAEAGHQKKIIYEMQAPGGVRLKDHWNRTETRKALADEKWDYVVLQDQSTLGTNYYFEGTPRIPSDELFHTYAMDFAKSIKESGAIPVFYMTWARKTVPQDQDALTAAYMRATRETKAIISPVGMAWAEVEKEHPAIELFYKDGSHPSAAGSYLAACVFYATIFGRSPEGLPSRMSVGPVSLYPENAPPGKNPILIDLPAAEARQLQEAAWNASVLIRLHGPSLSTAIPPVPTLPALPRGEPLNPPNLAGTWTGKILFFPAGPVDMRLRLRPSMMGWTGHLDLNYHAKDIPDESLELGDIKVSEDQITFTDPKSIDVNNLPVHFTGVVTGPGEMRGTAETSVDRGDESVKLIGDWKLVRR
ncbi:MAG TPA: DUF4886 domain-containing protein [Terriglobales bacterium]|nr:DUF4886 domain-containing protein [Terriglobales bacterium]